MRKIILLFVWVFVSVPLFSVAWSEESTQKKFKSIVNILLQNESFRKFPSSEQQEFFNAVRACEESDLVQVDFEHMSPFRATQLTNLLGNWCERFTGGIDFPLDVRKKDLRAILANHLYRPVFVPSAENAAKVKTQLEAIPGDSMLSLGGGTDKRMSNGIRAFMEPILSRFIEGITNDMTPLFKYPLGDGAYRRLVDGMPEQLIRADTEGDFGAPNDFSDPRKYVSMMSASEIESLIVQAYTEAMPSDVRQKVETLVESAEEFTDAKHLAQTINEIAQSQHEKDRKKFEEEFYGEFNRQAEMIQLEENGKILEGDAEVNKKNNDSFLYLRIFCITTGLILIFIALGRIVFRMISKR